MMVHGEKMVPYTVTLAMGLAREMLEDLRMHSFSRLVFRSHCRRRWRPYLLYMFVINAVSRFDANGDGNVDVSGTCQPASSNTNYEAYRVIRARAARGADGGGVFVCGPSLFMFSNSRPPR
ncbi:hypothetical protein EVAR_775_1 [Eumeta japonica]|uniref:Uncharacterized protein n=1 Tax=Eumeta variegata TaxID=151549 RepID=A0A4C1SE72_EUMVA|nr:hypothetical protein EVAR_775_1 [Eumeta japonica]